MTVTAGKTVLHARTDPATAEDRRRCATIVGEPDDPPLGYAFVLALRTLMAWGGLPDGAIMMGHRATWIEPPGDGALRTELAIIEADQPRTRYQRVVIGFRTLRAGDGRLVISQEQEVLWPNVV